ncbi:MULTISPECIES: DUF4239 domain-containing protein [unclassified Sphingomonas]|uniref:bestrophin-like domain n=1 Tax=unclassified Sphingomonas TaxID=196159 RepID=UPI00226A315E|nr:MULTISPECIES: DUF4239 domain-containing protein [unclassified Sphingomonas]
MTLYWLYDLPSWLFATIVIAFFVVFGVGGLHLTRGWVRQIHKVDHSHNDIVGYFLAALTVFYGITLGLVAIGTWETFSAVGDKVDGEAAVVASLYRDVGSYREPVRSELRHDLSGYLANVITVSWPLQQQGIVPTESGRYVNAFQDHLMAYAPAAPNEQILQGEVFKQLNVLIETRRARLNAVDRGLPAPIWALVVIGGLLCITTTWFFHTASYRMHLWMTVQMCALLGLLVFMVGILDNPFRGRVSVGSGPLELVRAQLVEAPVANNVRIPSRPAASRPAVTPN